MIKMNIKIKRSVVFFIVIFVLFTAVLKLRAQVIEGTNPPVVGGSNQTVQINLPNPFRGANSLFDLLRIIINDILMPIGGVIAVLAFIYSGFLYVTAQGRETQLAKAHKALLATSIGTAVLLGSWVIANVIKTTIEQLQP